MLIFELFLLLQGSLSDIFGHDTAVQIVLETAVIHSKHKSVKFVGIRDALLIGSPPQESVIWFVLWCDPNTEIQFCDVANYCYWKPSEAL